MSFSVKAPATTQKIIGNVGDKRLNTPVRLIERDADEGVRVVTNSLVDGDRCFLTRNFEFHFRNFDRPSGGPCVGRFPPEIHDRRPGALAVRARDHGSAAEKSGCQRVLPRDRVRGMKKPRAPGFSRNFNPAGAGFP